MLFTRLAATSIKVPGQKVEKLGGTKRNSGDFRMSIFFLLVLATTVSLSWYLVFRGLTFLNPGYSWFDRIFAVFLLGGESFLFFHTIGYLLSVVKSSWGYGTLKGHFFVSVAPQSVAVVVAAYNEEPEIVEEALASISNLDYSGKRLYLLDDSANTALQQRIEGLAKKYGWTYVHRDHRRGYKAGALNDLLKNLGEKYLAVFDADQKPVPNFLDQVISLLEEDPKLAFIQTPQFYHNPDQSAVASGAAFQQVVFYEYICEGKSVSNAMFSCGSNVVYRVEALRSVGGFEEKSVTEDFATGLKLHLGGWKSAYYNYVCVYGLGPESLPGYLTQQMRWALGTMALFKKILLLLVTKPGALKIGQWWEYSLSGSYYLVGWANLFLVLCPIAFLLFDVRPLVADMKSYLAAFLPYFTFSMSTFYFSMLRRGYKPGFLLAGQCLGINSFWAQINASVMALFNIKRHFGVTPKGKSSSLQMKYLLPHILLTAASAAAIVAGIYKLTHGYGAVIVFNLLWAGYHAFILGMVFYFNRPSGSYQATPVFIKATEAR